MILNEAVAAMAFESLDHHRRRTLADPVLCDGRADPAKQPLGLIFAFLVQRMDETERKPRRRFDLYGEIRNHVRHQGLIDERLLKGAPPSRMMSGLRQRMTHESRRADREIEPRVMVHLQPFTNAVAGLANEMSNDTAEFDLGRSVGPVAALVLEPLDLQAIAGAVGQPACDDKTGYALFRSRKRQEHVRVRHGEEPLVANERIGPVRIFRRGCLGLAQV